MRSFPRVILAAVPLWFAVALPVSAQSIPALNEIPPQVAATRADLTRERAALEAERSDLRGRVMAQKAECGSVEQNTPQWQNCLQSRTQLQEEMKAHIARTNAFNASIAASPAAGPARQYTFAGNGLIAGTTWTAYASRKPGEPEERMCNVIKQQSKLAGSAYDEGVDCKRYEFVLGMAISVDAFTDLKNRVAFDDLTNGQFSAKEQGLYEKLRGKAFGELACHSNGAMICLAALENKDITADRVVLYGPQVTRESLEMWDDLVRRGQIKEVKVYLNQNDVVPGVSIAYADYKKNQVVSMAADAALFNVDSLKRTINEISPRLEVQTFPCERDRTSMECHSMAMYRAKLNCTGRSSGQAVPGTALHGGDALPEPPMPCEVIGGRP